MEHLETDRCAASPARTGPDPDQIPNGFRSTHTCAVASVRRRTTPGAWPIGEVMQGGGVGEVVESNHPDWKAGDIAESMDVGWQEWSVLTPDLPGRAGVNKVDPA